MANTVNLEVERTILSKQLAHALRRKLEEEVIKICEKEIVIPLVKKSLEEFQMNIKGYKDYNGMRDIFNVQITLNGEEIDGT